MHINLLRLYVRLAKIIFANLFSYSAFFLLFMGLTVIFYIINRFHCIISAKFYFYLQYFQQKNFSFSKIGGAQMNSMGLFEYCLFAKN